MMRESGRANMQRTIKRLLAKYDYPKEARSKIIDLLVEQAEYFDGMVVWVKMVFYCYSELKYKVLSK